MKIIPAISPSPNMHNRKSDTANNAKDIIQKEIQPNSFENTNASAAIKSMYMPLNFTGISKQTALRVQIENLKWADEEEKKTALKRIEKMPDDRIELLSSTIQKIDTILSDEMKKGVPLNFITYECAGSKDEEVQKIKNYNFAQFNKLNTDFQSKYAKQAFRIFPALEIKDPEGINKIYEVLDEDSANKIFDSFEVLATTKEEHKQQLENAKAIMQLDENIRERINLDKIIAQKKVNGKTIQEAVKYLNGLDKEKTDNLNDYYLNELLSTDYSYSLDNQNSTPVAGTDKFHTFHTKQELKKELASYRDENGKFGFDNEHIDKILNNENDIGELSVVLDGIARSGIDFGHYEIYSLLMTEGIALKNIKDRLAFISDILQNSEDETIKDAINENKVSILTASGKEFEKVAQNLELIQKIKLHYPDLFEKDGCHGVSSYIYRILKSANVTPENFEKMVNAGFIPKNAELWKLEDILRDESLNNINDKNIQLYKDLKSDKRLASLFYEEEKGETVEKDASFILKLDVPDDFDIKKKDEIIDLISEIEADSHNLGFDYRKDEYINILLKKDDDTIEDGRKIVEFLKTYEPVTHCNNYEFFVNHSFKDTLELLEAYRRNPLKKSYYTIPKYSVELNKEFLELADYIASFDAFKDTELESQDIIRDMQDFPKKFNKDIQKTKVDNLDKASKLMPDEIWQQIKNYALKQTLSEENHSLKPENIKYFSNLLQDERFNKYFILAYYNIADLMSADLDIEKIKENKEKLLAFAEKYAEIKENKNFDVIWCDKDMAGFEGDIEKLDNEISLIKNQYDTNEIYIAIKNNSVELRFDDKYNSYEILFDKNMNLLRINSSQCEVLEDGTEISFQDIKDKKRNSRTQIALTNDPLYDYPIPLAMETVYFDDFGTETKRKIYQKSDVDGVLQITETYPDGMAKTLSEAIESNSGALSIKKDLESPAGVKTKIEYKKDEQGNELYTYIIEDKNGNELANLKRRTEVINENTKITTVNEKQYKVTSSKNKITILDMQTSATTEIDLNKINPENNAVLADMLNGLSGDELIKVNEYVKKLTLTDRIDSGIDPMTKEMLIGPHKFIFEHELGHAKDELNITAEELENIENQDDVTSKIASDPELQKIFEEEKQEMKKVCTEAIQKEINYFIDDENHYGGKLGGLREAIAETNAIQNCAKTHPFLQMRTQLLMEYFPKTIAYLINNHL